jgi:catechol 2,3-dioxygenase-like lactoylglutathione lyase family enzyme
VSDQERAKRFYRDVVGFERLREEPMAPGQKWIQLAPQGCSTTIALVTWFDAMRPGGLQGVMLNVTDIDQDHAALTQRGHGDALQPSTTRTATDGSCGSRPHPQAAIRRAVCRC